MRNLLFIFLQLISITAFAECTVTAQPGGGKLVTCPTSVVANAQGQSTLQMNPTPVQVAPKTLETYVPVSVGSSAPSINYGGGVDSGRYDQIRPGFYQDRSNGHIYSRSSETNRRR